MIQGCRGLLDSLCSGLKWLPYPHNPLNTNGCNSSLTILVLINDPSSIHKHGWMMCVLIQVLHSSQEFFYIKQCNYPQLILWWGAKCFSLQVSKSFKLKFGLKMSKAQLNQFDQYEGHYTFSHAAWRRNLKLSVKISRRRFCSFFIWV